MSWLHVLWFHYFWPSDLGNGPENIQWTVLAIIAASFLIPAVRNFFKRLESKVDHIITNHPDIPEYDEAKAEFEKWEHWLVTLVKSFSKRRRMSNKKRIEELNANLASSFVALHEKMDAQHVAHMDALKPRVKPVVKKAAPVKTAKKSPAKKVAAKQLAKRVKQ